MNVIIADLLFLGLLQLTYRLDHEQSKFSYHRGHRSGSSTTAGDIPSVLFMQVNRKVSRNAIVSQHNWRRKAVNHHKQVKRYKPVKRLHPK